MPDEVRTFETVLRTPQDEGYGGSGLLMSHIQDVPGTRRTYTIPPSSADTACNSLPPAMRFCSSSI